VTAGRVKLGAQALAVGAVVALLALLIWRVAHGSPSRPTGAAPAFQLSRLEGQGALSLSSLRGKVVVLNFWASWCIPCKQEAGTLEAGWQRWRSRGVVVLGVDSEDFSGDGRRFAHRYGVTYPLLRDGAGSVKDRYGVSGYPETFFIDPKGKVVSSVAGPVSASVFDTSVKQALTA
jgi:cytochrome c biogenesis protein CcmG/thiol:disulfide interchange protein DsbE